MESGDPGLILVLLPDHSVTHAIPQKPSTWETLPQVELLPAAHRRLQLHLLKGHSVPDMNPRLGLFRNQINAHLCALNPVN
jgi:hypothetical protein